MSTKFQQFLIMLLVVISGCSKAPKACIDASSTEVPPGQEITFTSCSENEQDLIWDFGDNTTGKGAVVKKAYVSSGTYEVKLTAKNKKSESSTSVSVTVTAPPAPVIDAAICSFPSSVSAGTPVNFSSCSSNATSFNWNFGDGSTATGSNVTHTYSNAGNYTVTLSVNSTYGADVATAPINVTPFQPSSFSGVYNGSADCSGSPFTGSTTVNVSGTTITMNGVLSGISFNITGTYNPANYTFTIPSQVTNGNTVSGNGYFQVNGINREMTFNFSVLLQPSAINFNCFFTGIAQ